MTEKLLNEKRFDLFGNEEMLRQEVERKLVPLNPEQFADYKQVAVPIEQVYLSQPGEDYTLRVRASYEPTGTQYMATLKNRGIMTPDGLSRLEVETLITQATYERYATNEQLPRVKKLRATLVPGVTVDWIDGVALPLIEIEASATTPSAAQFYEDYRSSLIDMTGDPQLDNSAIAYEHYGMIPEKSPELQAETIVEEMVAQLKTGKSQVIVGISGMSGSGKTTLANQVEQLLQERYGDKVPAPTRLSTDDYHRGKTWLETTYGAPWTNWDDPVVYDTATMAEDVQALQAGQSIPKKRFDFEHEEVVCDGELAPSPFVIIEGIFAGSPDLREVRDLHFAVATPVATTVGRDIMRLMHSDRPNHSIASPEQRLRYQLEVAIPTYESQPRPARNSWSASVRSIGRMSLLGEL